MSDTSPTTVAGPKSNRKPTGRSRRKIMRTRSVTSAANFGCEMLEQRRLLTGTWTTLSNAVPSGDGAQSGLVLTNGNIMVHGGGGGASATWYKLTPNSAGSYVSGTWSSLTSMSTNRLYTATNVLQNGTVFELGGEYSGPSGAANWSNTGQIYNPFSNSWSNITNFPNSQFGDDPSVLLPNGNILCGYLSGPQTYIYSPSANTWTATGSKLRSDRSDEESWVVLPGGNVLSYDVFSSVSLGTPHAQLYNVSNGTWQDAGSPPAQLSSANVGYELGPGLLLPDGRVFFAGGTNATAYYTPSTNSWAAGPAMPGGYVMADAPGAVLPNGNLLLAMSPLGSLVGGGYNFPSPTKIYELNPSTNVYTDVTPAISSFNMNMNSFRYTMLMLPTGQVAVFNDSGTVAVYTESGSPVSAAIPSISNINNDSGTNVFTLSGYNLNGINAGASYGDDAEMDSNYPLVRLTTSGGTVIYATTTNWSLTGVSNGYETVNFTMPAGYSQGAYLVNVVANGVASATVLNVALGGYLGENTTLQENANTNYVDITNAGNGGTVENTFYIGAFNSTIITGDAASNTIVINCNFFGRATISNGGDGNDYLRMENNGTGYTTEYGGNGVDYFDFSFYNDNLGNIQGFTYVYGGAGLDYVWMYDNNVSAANTYTVDAAEVNRSGFGGMYYGADIEQLTLTTGTGADVVNVPSTYSVTPVYLYSAGGVDTVNIGSGGSVQSIAASIYVYNSPSFTTINIDDSADATAHNDILIDSGSLTNLAPAVIYWNYPDINGLNISGGTGGNTFYVTTAGIYYTTTLNLGAGNDTAEFENGSGDPAGTFVVNGQGGTDSVIVIDEASTTQSYTITSSALSRSGLYVGYGTIESVYLDVGPGTNTVDVESLPAASVTVNGGTGTNTYNVATGSHVVPYVGYGLYLNGGVGGSVLNIDDTLDTIATGVYVYNNAVGVSTAGYIYYSALNTLNYSLPAYGNNVYFYGTNQTTFYQINSGSAADTVDIGAGDLTYVVSDTIFSRGGIYFNDAAYGGADALIIDGSSSSNAYTYDFNAYQVLLPGHLNITYGFYLYSIVVDAGTGADVYNVTATVIGCPLTINTSGGNDSALVTGDSSGSPVVFNAGNGTDTFVVGATGGTLSALAATVTVNGYAGKNDTLTVNDRTDANFAVSSSAVQELSGTTAVHEVDYSNLVSVALNSGAGGNGYLISVNSTAAGTPVTLDDGAGTVTINDNSTAANAPVIILPTGGADPVNVIPAAGATASAEFPATETIGLLTVANNGRAFILSGTKKTLFASGITASGSGVLDVYANDVVVHSGSVAALSALLKTGFASGTWSGAGIDSTVAHLDTTARTALGILLNNDGFGNRLITTLDGQTVLLNDVMIKYTYYGDADLNGRVNGSDYTRIDNGFNNHLTGWSNGDFNYDGAINGSDYTLIDNGYNTQGSPLSDASGPSGFIGSGRTTAQQGTTAASSAAVTHTSVTRTTAPGSAFAAAGINPVKAIPAPTAAHVVKTTKPAAPIIKATASHVGTGLFSNSLIN